MTIVGIGVQMFELVKRSSVVLVFLALAAIGSQAQTFNVLATFSPPDGNQGNDSGLIQGINGNFYGTTWFGGATGRGAMFEISPAGSLSTVYSFCVSACADGFSPTGVVMASDGNFYGTTSTGGGSGCTSGCGTVFKITQKGMETTLHIFDGTDGGSPRGGLVQAFDGSLYGTTSNFGADSGGTVFRISSMGALTTLHNFCSEPSCVDGWSPVSGLVQGSDGNFYGTTSAGGKYGRGTIFRITRSGILTRLYSFCSQTSCADGAQPEAGLVQGADGTLYGTTVFGGNNNYGTIFRITPTGVFTTLYVFCSQGVPCIDGSLPFGGLMLATDGNFYGTTSTGGANCGLSGCGTLFKITPSGTLTTLHSFCDVGCPDGNFPDGPLLESTTGIIYGMTEAGGVSTACGGGCGTVYSLDMGFGPFVTFVMKVGKVGGKAGILGQGFTGTTAVSFNGVPASFTVHSDTLLLAKVPSGATTGSVTVTTPSGTLTSNVAFQVIP